MQNVKTKALPNRSVAIATELMERGYRGRKQPGDCEPSRIDTDADSDPDPEAGIAFVS